MAADSNMWLVDSYNRWYPIDAWKDLVSGKVARTIADLAGARTVQVTHVAEAVQYRRALKANH